MNWKDTLLPGASRTPIPFVGQAAPAGYVLDDFHKRLEASGAGPVFRNDWVAGPGGRPVISGSSEGQVGAGAVLVPSPGFLPVDPGVYGGQVFAGRAGGSPGGLASAVQPILDQLGAFAALPTSSLSAAGLGAFEAPDDYAAALEDLRRFLSGLGRRKKLNLGGS